MKAVAFALSLIAAGSAFADPANSCSDPYWKDTLRCVFFPDELPQPNLYELPRANTIGKFTRVFLQNPDVRCTDGTRPLMYVDKAVPESNRWIITMSGGDSCNGERCAFFYAQGDERAFMGSSTKGPMRDMDGIHDPDPLKNPIFAGYNRVRIEKCSFDRYMGRSQETAIKATAPNGTAISFDAYHHGFRIMQEALKTLAPGLRYTTWRRKEAGSPENRRRACCGAPGNAAAIVETHENLPPLANAEVVLFIGHSNASHGLYHNIDNLAAELAAIPGFRGDVRALFDENFLPSVENEAAGKDIYDSVWTGNSTARGEPFSYDGERYHATDAVDADFLAHGALLDTSCLQAHPNDAWKCRDRQHVLFNHIATPFMIRQDFTDPNREHLDAPQGHWIRWGTLGHFSYCPIEEMCPPRFNAAEFRTRLEKQIQTLLTHAWTRSELARGIDKTTGPLPTMYVWMPQCGQHDGSFSDDPFFAVTIATDVAAVTMRQFLEDFMKAPRSGVRRYLIDAATDASGRRMRTTQCH
jgi:Pectinacetylesterase